MTLEHEKQRHPRGGIKPCQGAPLPHGKNLATIVTATRSASTRESGTPEQGSDTLSEV